MTIWKVTIQFFFKRTNLDRTKKEEPNPTKKQLDAYMRKGSKYKQYLEDMYMYGDYGEMPKKIKYRNGGKLSYELSNTPMMYNYNTKSKIPVFPTAKSVVDYIMGDSFEDGLFEGEPGSAGVYPTKNKYKNNGSPNKYYEELGVIDCRKKATIIVKKKKEILASVKL